jgi:CheY-like chemotaxis protein
MPNMSGAEAFRELRSAQPDLPILVSSGHSEQDSGRQFLDAGLVGYIQKPYRGSELQTKLRQLLQRDQQAADG